MRIHWSLTPAWFVLAVAAGCTTAPQDDGGTMGNVTPMPGPVMPAPGVTPTPTPVQPSQPGVGVPPPVGTAGTGAIPPAAGSDAVPPMGGSDAMPPVIGDPIDMNFPDPRGQCQIDSGFPDDNACLVPPAPGEGIQIHVGPTDYNDAGQINTFTFAPGAEASACWTFHTPNTEELWYQSFVLSGRAGTHHIINTMYASDGPNGTTFTGCRDPGTGTNPDSIGNLPGASKAYMPRGRVAPEYANLGRKIPPMNYAEADMHYFNFTSEPLLREFWMNIYSVPRENITDEGTQIRAMGGLSWLILPIPMGPEQLFEYQCPINADGKIIALLGHYHSHGKRFAAYINDRKVFEMYDYLDPQIFQYNSITTNPDFSANAAGAVSGVLDVKAGDVIKWECLIHNDDQPGGLRYTNMVATGEMCNLWGESLGPKIDCVL